MPRPILDEIRPSSPRQWEGNVREVWDEATHREQWYAALALAGHRHAKAFRAQVSALPLYRHLVVSGAWWDVVDEVAAHRVGEVLAEHRCEATGIVRGWATDDDLWLRRTAILCQLRHRDQTDLDLLEGAVRANLLTSRHGRDFFIRKAVGWSLRQHSRVAPGWVIELVDDLGDDLSPLSRREALKHLRRE